MQLRIMMAFGESVFVDDPDSEEGYAEVFKATATRQLHLSDCIIGMGKTKFKPEALRMEEKLSRMTPAEICRLGGYVYHGKA